jgi:hypothetical protein
MAKTKKTAAQLLEMIAAEVPLNGVRVDIHKDDPMGWDANTYGDSDQADPIQLALRNAVERLRAIYDLEE